MPGYFRDEPTGSSADQDASHTHDSRTYTTEVRAARHPTSVTSHDT